ncbi:MAG: OmpH family outer membrane protein [Rhodospirillales bacterium]|nr:OmpH family outer membrane protein [Alphaproteobacteria bacterium]MBL6947841.1 OmpH family outer membrane protein [Rhodospirillales bacterium]
MSHIFKIFLTLLLGAFVFVSPVQAQQKAQPAKDKSKKDLVPVRIPFAVLDVQKILRNAKAVKNIRDQITAYGTGFEKEIEKEREALRKANQELARQRTILAPEAFAEKRREFEQRVVEVQRMVQKRQRDLDGTRAKAMNEVNKSYISIIEKLATERNLAMIIRKAQTAYAATSLDVTNEVLARLDKNLPTVKVVKPGK